MFIIDSSIFTRSWWFCDSLIWTFFVHGSMLSSSMNIFIPETDGIDEYFISILSGIQLSPRDNCDSFRVNLLISNLYLLYQMFSRSMLFCRLRRSYQIPFYHFIDECSCGCCFPYMHIQCIDKIKGRTQNTSLWNLITIEFNIELCLGKIGFQMKLMIFVVASVLDLVVGDIFCWISVRCQGKPNCFSDFLPVFT